MRCLFWACMDGCRHAQKSQNRCPPGSSEAKPTRLPRLHRRAMSEGYTVTRCLPPARTPWAGTVGQVADRPAIGFTRIHA